MDGVIAPLLAAKARRRHDLATLPIERKLEIVLELQRNVAEIRRSAGRRGPEPWDSTSLGRPPRATSHEDLLPALEGASFALVFGSFGTDRFGPESDIDLAVRFPKPLPIAERFDLAQRLSEIAGRNVDLVDLATADPIIAMQVLRHGKPLLVHDRAAFETFRMTAPSRYFDWKLSRRPVEERLWAEAGAR